jgi:hypothetical protein
MNRRTSLILAAGVVLVALLAVVLAGVVVPGGAAPAKAAEPVVLTVKHAGTVVKTYSLADLQALAHYDGYAGFITSGGTLHGPDPVTGVTLVAILQDAGLGLDASQSLNLLAPDGYPANLSYNQVVNGTPYDIIDATTKELTTPASTLTPVLVYARNGVALDPFDPISGEGEGPLRFYVAQLTDTNQVMDGGLSVSGVAALDVLDQPITEWKLRLVGLRIRGTRQIVTETRNSIEGCATPNCHKSGWTDPSSSRAWTGVPLWRLLGVVDGGRRHKGNSYNDALARKGYRIRFFDAVGHTRTISSKIVRRRESIIVANLMDGVIPDAAYYPLRLVGPAKYVPEGRRLGRIVKIQLLPWR